MVLSACEVDPTQLVVVVDSDMAVPSELDALRGEPAAERFHVTAKTSFVEKRAGWKAAPATTYDWE